MTRKKKRNSLILLVSDRGAEMAAGKIEIIGGETRAVNALIDTSKIRRSIIIGSTNDEEETTHQVLSVTDTTSTTLFKFID